MNENSPFCVRLSPVEKREIERIAKALGMTPSAYSRLALLGGSAAKKTESEQSELAERIGLLETRIAEQEEAFVLLLEHLREQQRQPSFSEFRARYLAELPPDEKVPGATDVEQLLHIARAYYRAYGQWPQSRPARQFGRMPKDMPPDAWPANPV